jgi:hypothetical protein
VANIKAHGVQARVGLNVDTGVSFTEDKVEVKAAGIGLTIGKQIGVSTPVGEIKVDADNCTIQ